MGDDHSGDSAPADDPWAVADEAALRGLYGTTSERAKAKSLSALDAHCTAFIERSPFLCLSSQDGSGRADVSPRGDPAGFVRVLDPRTLAVPDRPGNNRLDTLSNLLANPAVGLLFFVPGYEETLRVNGTARLTRDPKLLASLVVKGREPSLAIVVSVDEAFLHCAKALRRSRLWDPEARRDRREMPSLSKMILDQTVGAPEDPAEMARIDEQLEREYRDSMY